MLLAWSVLDLARMYKAKRLTRRLRVLEPREELARVAGGGETASTSTSGRPAVGDDTIGDTSFRDLPDVYVTSWQM